MPRAPKTRGFPSCIRAIGASLAFALGVLLGPAAHLAPAAHAQPLDEWALTSWKGEGWQTDFTKISVEPSSIRSGGPPKDGIPSIDAPQFVPVSEASDLADVEPVIGLEIDGDARAYPLRVLTWHEIVNDVVGGVPVIVTYCPLCNAAIVFKRTVNGEPVEFGTTGKLRHSDMVMYDRATESWWQQFTGEAIAGERLGERLPLVASRLESWAQFRARHPNGRVLVPNDPTMRPYGSNPYAGYDTARRPFLYDGALPEGIDPMERVVVLRGANDDPTVVTMNAVREAGTLEVKGTQLTWEAGQASALDTRAIPKGRDVGTIIATRDGKDVPYDVTFAFVTHAFHPDTEITGK